MRSGVKLRDERATTAAWLAAALLLLSLCGLLTTRDAGGFPANAFLPAGPLSQVAIAERGTPDPATRPDLVREAKRGPQAAWTGAGGRGDILRPEQAAVGQPAAGIAFRGPCPSSCAGQSGFLAKSPRGPPS